MLAIVAGEDGGAPNCLCRPYCSSLERVSILLLEAVWLQGLPSVAFCAANQTAKATKYDGTQVWCNRFRA